MKSEPIPISLKFDALTYIPIQVACGSKHSIVVAIPEDEYKKLADAKKDQVVELDKILSNPKWTTSQVVFSAGVPTNGRLGRACSDE